MDLFVVCCLSVARGKAQYGYERNECFMVECSLVALALAWHGAIWYGLARSYGSWLIHGRGSCTITTIFSSFDSSGIAVVLLVLRDV